MDMIFHQKSASKPQKVPETTKWWLLKGDKADEFRQDMEDMTISMDVDVNLMWQQAYAQIMKAANRILGRTKPDKKSSRETWWWNPTKQIALQEKKRTFKIWQSTRSQKDRDVYKTAKKRTKKTVAIERRKVLGFLYNTLESRDGQKEIFKLSKSRSKASEDPVKTRAIKGCDGAIRYSDEAS
ncbi:unnamed protein product, partial [Brenthis ino]